MTNSRADRIAEWFDQQHRTRQSFRSHEELTRADLAFAYDVQDRLVAMRAARGEQVAGYKIGLTTARMQQMCGLEHPIAGAILSGGVHRSPFVLKSVDFVRLGLECEIAVKLATPLDGRTGALTHADIAASVEKIAAAFEVIEDRAADYKSLDMPGLIADNSWNAGMIAAASRPLLDLDDLTGRLFINGQETDSGSTRDVLEHPLNSIAWLSDHLARRHQRIEAGQWIMTGTIIPTRFPQAGDHYRFELPGLDAVEVRIS